MNEKIMHDKILTFCTSSNWGLQISQRLQTEWEMSSAPICNSAAAESNLSLPSSIGPHHDKVQNRSILIHPCSTWLTTLVKGSGQMDGGASRMRNEFCRQFVTVQWLNPILAYLPQSDPNMIKYKIDPFWSVHAVHGWQLWLKGADRWMAAQAEWEMSSAANL